MHTDQVQLLEVFLLCAACMLGMLLALELHRHTRITSSRSRYAAEVLAAKVRG
jgi:hypothetical protein